MLGQLWIGFSNFSCSCCCGTVIRLWKVFDVKPFRGFDERNSLSGLEEYPVSVSPPVFVMSGPGVVSCRWEARGTVLRSSAIGSIFRIRSLPTSRNIIKIPRGNAHKKFTIFEIETVRFIGRYYLGAKKLFQIKF